MNNQKVNQGGSWNGNGGRGGRGSGRSGRQVINTSQFPVTTMLGQDGKTKRVIILDEDQVFGTGGGNFGNSQYHQQSSQFPQNSIQFHQNSNQTQNQGPPNQ